MATRADCLRWLVRLAVLNLCAAVFFSALPELDLAISGLFATDGVPFPASQVPVWKAVRSAMFAFTNGLAAVVLGVLVLSRFLPFLRVVKGRVLGFVLLAYAMVPGLLVNGLLKPFFGRARPRSIAEFGGDALYTAPLVISDQCHQNCSFVSGETSALITMTTLLLLIFVPRLTGATRLSATITLCTVAAFGSALRIAFGAHFLSDVVFSVLWSSAAVLILYLVCGLDRLESPFVARPDRSHKMAMHDGFPETR